MTESATFTCGRCGSRWVHECGETDNVRETKRQRNRAEALLDTLEIVNGFFDGNDWCTCDADSTCRFCEVAVKVSGTIRKDEADGD